MTNVIVLKDARLNKWIEFRNPETILATNRFEDVPPILREVERLTQKHRYFAAGFMRYEAGRAFDPAVRVKLNISGPLIWFGIYKKPRILPGSALHNGAPHFKWTPTISKTEYSQAFSKIKNHIAAGNCYQVNYSFRLASPFAGSPALLFDRAIKSQHVPYPAFIETEEEAVLSASPELFFSLNENSLKSKPMKGTAPRGTSRDEDCFLSDRLLQSEKERAENVMIVDMVRNDMGKVAVPGSVQVPELFSLETYPTVFQMTSTVTARTAAPFHEIMAALFPAASVTGAPKPRVTEIISQLESTPREIYTGTIGYLAPRRLAQFNVAIRTMLVKKLKGRAEYGVGSGVVWDSEVKSEYNECLSKARIVTG